MGKKAAGNKQKVASAGSNRRRAFFAAALALSMIAGSVILAQRSRPRTSSEIKHKSGESRITPASLDPASPSKEYIYAGGKLIATEEPPATACPVTFEDVSPGNSAANPPISRHPYYEDICEIATRGITLGCGTGSYCPNDPVTRAQMAVFIERSLGILNPPTPTSQRFTDVPPTYWAYAFIDDFAKRGITLGCGAGTTFCPEEIVRHEQMAAFMERAVGRFQPPLPPIQVFCDVPPSNGFYNEIYDYSSVRGIWRGCDDVGTGNCPSGCARCFCPSRSVTRAEMARILVRNFNGFPPVPSAPTGVSAIAGNAKVTLFWNATSGATAYKVRRSTTSGTGYVDVNTVTGTSYLDQPLTNGVTYYYVIAAVNSNGSVGLNSNQVSAIPQ